MTTKVTQNAIGIPMTYTRNGDNLILGIRCTGCDKPYEVRVTSQQFYDWQHGKLVQDAFPHLSAGGRELLISGICDDCFPKDSNE